MTCDVHGKIVRRVLVVLRRTWFNPLTGTLKPQNNGPSYSNTVIGALAVDGWAVTLILYQTAHPSTASVPTSYYSMWHYNYR